MDVIQYPESVEGTPLGLLVKVVKDVLDNLGDPFRGGHCLLPVNCRYLLVQDALLLLDGVDVVNPERKDILIIDGIHNGVGVELVPKGLLVVFSLISPPVPAFCAKMGVPVKPKRLYSEVLGDGCMHLTKILL